MAENKKIEGALAAIEENQVRSFSEINAGISESFSEKESNADNRYFPGASGALRVYFESCPPIRPFDASGWRFVRAPSSVRGAAYCALGMFQREGRVSLIAYALPGHPQRPPVPLPGYRYQMGLRGQGYWVFTERV